MRDSRTLPSARSTTSGPAWADLVGAEQFGVEHLRVPRHVEHDGVAVVVGVHRMEDVAGLDVEPTDVNVPPSRGMTPTRAG